MTTDSQAILLSAAPATYFDSRLPGVLPATDAHAHVRASGFQGIVHRHPEGGQPRGRSNTTLQHRTAKRSNEHQGTHTPPPPPPDSYTTTTALKAGPSSTSMRLLPASSVTVRRPKGFFLFLHTKQPSTGVWPSIQSHEQDECDGGDVELETLGRPVGRVSGGG